MRRVGVEGKTRIGHEINGQVLISNPNNLPATNQHKPKILLAKKGVTSGMKLAQPKQKNDDLYLDLTI